jgi:hypothetical protein
MDNERGDWHTLRETRTHFSSDHLFFSFYRERGWCLTESGALRSDKRIY